jgi:hypothetical protein
MVADHVVFLISLACGMRSWPVESAVACEVPGCFTWLFQQVIAPGNRLWTRTRLRDLKAAGFGLREIVMIDLPRSFPWPVKWGTTSPGSISGFSVSDFQGLIG